MMSGVSNVKPEYIFIYLLLKLNATLHSERLVLFTIILVDCFEFRLSPQSEQFRINSNS